MKASHSHFISFPELKWDVESWQGYKEVPQRRLKVNKESHRTGLCRFTFSGQFNITASDKGWW